MLIDSINIEPFSFPALEQLGMSFPHMGFVLGQIQSAPALVNLEIGLGPNTYNAAIQDTGIPQIYPSLATMTIDDHTDLLQFISTPALSNLTISGERLGDNPHFTDFLRRHANIIIQLSADSRGTTKSLVKFLNPNFTPPSESPIPLEMLCFPRLEVLHVPFDGSLSKLQGAVMPELKQFTTWSCCGGSPKFGTSAPWTVDPSSFRAPNIADIAPTEPSLRWLRHLFDASICLSHITIRDTSIVDPSTSVRVMNALAESRSCASLTTVNVILPPDEERAPFFAALRRLVNAHHDATTRKLERVELAEYPHCCFPDQETRSWLEEHIIELILL